MVWNQNERIGTGGGPKDSCNRESDYNDVVIYDDFRIEQLTH
jgi:hypothetical protein